jgi:hypothetical protein
LSDRRDNRCLVGALDFVSSHHAIQSDAAERYLADEISALRNCNDAGVDFARFQASLRQALWGGGRYRVSEIVLRRDSLSDFNDWCKDFSELRALILQARAAAMNDAEPARTFTGWTTPASPGAPLLLHRSGLAPPTPCRSPGAPVRKLARSICV